MKLQLLSSDKIDKQKWDECLLNSSNQLIYASSAYLNCMTDKWEGIVGDDYELIMPIPWRKKFGIKYCYDVPFTQQLGAFGKTIEQKHIDACNKFLHLKYKYGSYAFNYMNPLNNSAVCNNYVLSLASNYKSTSFFYSSVIDSNLNNAKKFSLSYETAKQHDIINTFVELYAHRVPHLTITDYKKFSLLCKRKAAENNIILRKVCSKKETLAGVLFLKDKFRLYNLMFFTTDEGRKKSAGHFLFDNVIKEFSQSGLLLDFEGSSLPGVEKFNKSFGAIKQSYYKMEIKNLPFPLNLLKR